MSITVLQPGLQTTVQAEPRTGMRHLGVPASGPADPLSLALANRLVGNDLLAPALEVALVGPSLQFDEPCAFALTGGDAESTLNGEKLDFHRTVVAKVGDELAIASVEVGTRVYIAIGGGLRTTEMFGSSSTYMPAAFGGHQGRALIKGDVLETAGDGSTAETLETPEDFRPPISSRWAVRACRSAETHLLEATRRTVLFDTNWTIGRRADRMGMQLDGATLAVSSAGRMPSSPVFPGTIQCPEDGVPFILSIDSGTTGGYPRIAQITRADRHLLGQMRPGDHVRFLPREPQQAAEELQAKHDYWRQWLPGIERVI
jgi:5-oxoprolinase (ATP-hydrolysing) subunit C